VRDACPAGPRRRPAGSRAAAAAVAALVLASRLAAAQTPGGPIQEQVLVDNDTVRVALLVFPPGSASGEHVGLDPELGIVLEGELTLLTPGGREVLGPGSVRWLPALVPHDARNEGSVALRLWVVLVKR
jgi:quercetin dioxygenase-like cupin family protein